MCMKRMCETRSMGLLQLAITWYKTAMLESKLCTGTSKTKQLNLNYLCFRCPSGLFALQYGGFCVCHVIASCKWPIGTLDQWSINDLINISISTQSTPIDISFDSRLIFADMPSCVDWYIRVGPHSSYRRTVNQELANC